MVTSIIVRHSLTRVLCSWTIVTAIVGLTSISCFSLDDVSRFPCAKDKTCPDGYVCAGGACSPKCGGTAGAFCTASGNTLRCSTNDVVQANDQFGYPGFCTMVGCSDLTKPCPTGLFCVVDAKENGSSSCLDCTTTSQCPTGACCAQGKDVNGLAAAAGCIATDLAIAPLSCMP